MEEKGLQYSYIFTIVKFILFLLILCFLVGLSREFFEEISANNDFKAGVFYLSVLFPFVFCTFVSDLNNIYNKIQKFFFRSTFFSLLIPSFLVLLGICFFVLPRVSRFSFNKDIFLFLGGCAFTGHFIFIAGETKSSTFTAFINYLFIGSILYAIILIIFSAYLKIAFKIHLNEIIFEGIKGGIQLILNFSAQILR